MDGTFLAIYQSEKGHKEKAFNFPSVQSLDNFIMQSKPWIQADWQLSESVIVALDNYKNYHARMYF